MRGKTGVGEIDYRDHDEELIDDDFVDETSPGNGKYVLQSEIMDRGASAMTLDFLCN